MFPMISSVDEFLQAKAVVEDCIADLAAANIPHQAKPVVGMMVEVPSVLGVIDELARAAEFFSVGTNDLIQYVLAVDRTNEKIADLYVPHHPSVLRALKVIVDAAARHHRDISVCGDMAHEPRYIPFLTGIGVRKLSLDVRYIPKIQQRLGALNMAGAKAHAKELLGLSRLADIEEALRVMEGA